jgi:hypothetical protein
MRRTCALFLFLGCSVCNKSEVAMFSRTQRSRESASFSVLHSVGWKFKHTCERAHEIGTSHALASKQRFTGKESTYRLMNRPDPAVGRFRMNEPREAATWRNVTGFARIPPGRHRRIRAGRAPWGGPNWSATAGGGDRRAGAKVSSEPAADFARIRSSDSNGPPPLVGHGGIGPRP